MKCPSVMQKSTWKGSQGISVASEVGVIGVADGKGVGGESVFVGMTFVFTTMGVSVRSMFVQATRINNKK
jgi:hypothetical protein